MKRVTLILLVALAVLALLLPPSSFADDEAQSGESLQQSACGSDSPGEQGSVPESGNLLDRIAQAVLGIFDTDEPGSDEPLENVHPPDYNPPTDGPDGDEHGWDEHK